VEIQNDLLLRAASGKPTERTPVWLMRQAGRILPEYRELREKVKDFKTLVSTPDLACEVTLQPVDILGVDAAIIFSDILVIPEAMGLPYELVESKGPYFPKTISSHDDISGLKIAEPEKDLSFVTEAIKLVKNELNGRIPLIGFAGAPWTIFSYMIEGGGSKTFSKAKSFLYKNPEESHQMLQMITDSTIAYLRAQVQAGVNIVQLFDTWAGILSPQQYKTFSFSYIEQICNAIKEVPVIVFAKGAHFALSDFKDLNCEVIGLDWTLNIKEARKEVGGDKTLQGNMDPCLLYAKKDVIRKEAGNMLQQAGPTKYIANLGHGVYPDTPLDNVKCFIDTIKAHRFDQ